MVLSVNVGAGQSSACTDASPRTGEQELHSDVFHQLAGVTAQTNAPFQPEVQCGVGGSYGQVTVQGKHMPNVR
jgi:hypothetical protein